MDALSPMYYFLLPSSKIRDATFLFNEEGKNIIVIMSSAGYMYTQVMDESSSAQHGPFYVTNVLEINHEDLKVWNISYLENLTFQLVKPAETPCSFILRLRVNQVDLRMNREWMHVEFVVCLFHRTVMARWLEEESLFITPTSCRCSFSATVRASHLLPQWVGVTWRHRGSSPSMSKGRIPLIRNILS